MLLPFILFLLFTLTNSSPIKRSKSFCQIDPEDHRRWKSLLNEDFSTPYLNRSIWSVYNTDDSFDYTQDQCGDALCTTGNIFIDQGDLIIRSRKETRPSPSPQNDTKVYQYTTGGIHTQGKLDVYPNKDSLTRVCVRARVPMGELKEIDGKIIDTASGIGPNYQLMASNARRLFGNNVNMIEMDNLDFNSDYGDNEPKSTPRGFDPIPDPQNYFSCNPDEGQTYLMSHWGSNPNVTTSYHWQFDVNGPDGKICQGKDKSAMVSIINANLNLTDYHEWAIERSYKYIKFYLNGHLQTTWSTTSTTSINNTDIPMMINSTSPFFLTLSTIFGQGIENPILDDQIPENGYEHRIDWVRITHYDPGEPGGEQTIFQYAIFGVLIFAGVLFIALIICCSCCRKRDERLYHRNNTIRVNLRGEYEEARPENSHPLLTN